jgi:hypothetical protein
MHGHISPASRIVFIGKQLTHELLESKSPLLEDASFSILAKDHVLLGQC